jgi:hypothetical protein
VATASTTNCVCYGEEKKNPSSTDREALGLESSVCENVSTILMSTRLTQQDQPFPLWGEREKKKSKTQPLVLFNCRQVSAEQLCISCGRLSPLMHNAQLSEVPRLYLLRNLRRAKDRPEVASTGTAKKKRAKKK